MAGPFKFLVLFGSLLCIFIAANVHENTSIGVKQSIRCFRTDSKTFASTISDLQNALRNLDSEKPQTIEQAKACLISSRLAYKKIEYFLEYFFYTSSRIYNRAPKNEIEEPFLEYQELAGLQYIETLLFDTDPGKHKLIFEEQCTLLKVASQDLNSLVYQFQGNDAQLLESVRIELIRIISLGITGFDAPSLKSGIKESAVAMQAIQNALFPYIQSGKYKSDSLAFFLNTSVKYLNQKPDFDSFDRLQFLTKSALPLQKYLGQFIRDNDLEVNKYGVLNYNSEHMFSKNAFLKQSFPGQNRLVSKREIELGKKLFSEKALSGNGTKSCVSCHNPDLYFSDGLTKSIAFNPASVAKRNAPSLLYAGFQHSQFWDGRGKSLDDQIETVMKDPLEMNGNAKTVLSHLNADKRYKRMFRRAFPKGQKDRITEKEIYSAIAAYIGTLNPNNSAFDRYLSGNKTILSENEKAGFNLFMGKAQCGTCHFAPLFNGLIPPFYTLTEFEILGTTKSDDLTKPETDPDEGRFTFRPIKFYKSAFKTPTVRNVTKTGPYMHNGSFKTLESVIEFYNQGGAVGLGLELPSQTLSSAKLNLTEKEKKNIIEFLNALTDDLKNI